MVPLVYKMEQQPTKKEIDELAEKLFYELEPVDGLTWENCPYMIAREIINDAALRLGWKPNVKNKTENSLKKGTP